MGLVAHRSGTWNGATGAYVGGNRLAVSYSFASDGAVEYIGNL
jgi:hypothetical protein